MSRTDDFRAAIRQAELDRSLDGTWFVVLETAVLAGAVGLLANSWWVGAGVFFSLFFLTALVGASARLSAVACKIVFIAYASLIFGLLYSLAHGPGEIAASAVIALLISSLVTALHDTAFRSQRDISHG